MKRLALFCAFGLGMLGAPDARGAVIIQSVLSGHNTIPASGSGGSGIGTVILDNAQESITVFLSVFNLEGFATSAGIYGPANPGQSGPLLFPLSGIAIPPSQTSFNISGVFSITPDQVNTLLNRQFYFNVYSTAFPEGGISSSTFTAFNTAGPSGTGGELRGQIDTVVPEPATGAALLAGLGACFALRRRALAAKL